MQVYDTIFMKRGIGMNEQEKREILSKAKALFKDNIVENHIKNTKKLKKKKEFIINPFLINYLANFAFGDTSKESIAKALVYPRILGTSINTSFGAQIQTFCCEVLSGLASTTSGIDIEFVDALDGRKKYCQIKSGPNTINHADITSIKDDFKAIKNLARVNHLPNFNPNIDCIVGVLYGEPDNLSQFYKTINEEYPVIIGQEFWHRLTGDESFYNELIDSFVSVADEVDSTDLIKEVIHELSEQL